MSTLIAVIFRNDQDAAMSALHTLSKLDSDYLTDVRDAVVVRRRPDGKIQLIQTVNLTGASAWNGAVWAGLIGLIFTGPLGMILAGGATAGFGALLGAYSDYGVDDDFIERLARDVLPRCSALFILAREVAPDRIAEMLTGSRGELIRTSLSRDAEARLRRAMSAPLSKSVALELAV